MLIMEGNCLPESLRMVLPPSVEDIGWNCELYEWNSDASSLTAEDGKDMFCCSSAVKLDDRTAWTDEKHNLYLQHLEMSFVKQLHQSKRLLSKCSVQNQRGTDISQEQLINVIIPHGLATGSEYFSTNNPHHGDIYDLTREGMGQNFLDEDNRSTSNYESLAKRSKTASVDSSSQNQIVPSTKCPTSDSSVFNRSLHGDELTHHESVSEKF